MSSTTALMMSAETGIFLLFFGVMFLLFLLMGMYMFWPVKRRNETFHNTKRP